jgi:hypothetical protein
MLKVAGSASLSFVFPARRPIAYAFYSDMQRLVSYLPHIELLYEETEFEYRMRYQSTELGTYHLSIFCDVGWSCHRETASFAWCRLKICRQLKPS